jgi:TDG/mug DNA glycosylase family protein
VSDRPWRPTREQVAAAAGRTIPDVLVPGLDVLFCGIDPSLYSGAVGHHFARPGNRFWKALHGSGFTDRVLSPFEDTELPRLGLGLTNLVERATAGAAELSAEELRGGARSLEDKVRRFGPGAVAILGVSAYRVAFERPKASIGPQQDGIATSRLWVLPNPSGLNAHHQLPDLIRWFAALREAAVLGCRS